jgi:hypothetical protein
MQEVIIGGIYQHFKGDFYQVLGIAKMEETLEEMVIYISLYTPRPETGYNTTRIRTKKNFLELVERDTYR